MSTKVAFVGLGNMGGPMAVNLVKAGHEVTGFDLSEAALEHARSEGVQVAPSAQAAVAGAQVVITMLPSGKHLIEAYQGPEGLLAAAAPGTVFLDCSTVDVVDARAAAELAVAAGHRAVDAPVSGGTVGAAAGTLTFMVGGPQEDFETVRPLLEVMGRNIVHCGGAGAGQAAKICNNMVLGVSMIAASEAFVLGERLGLSAQALYDVLSTSSGQCWAVTTNCPVPGPVPTSPANRDYQPGFMGALMNKDLGLALNAIEHSGTAARLGPLAAEIYRDYAQGEGATRDFSGIITEIRDASGTVRDDADQSSEGNR